MQIYRAERERERERERESERERGRERGERERVTRFFDVLLPTKRKSDRRPHKLPQLRPGCHENSEGLDLKITQNHVHAMLSVAGGFGTEELHRPAVPQ